MLSHRGINVTVARDLAKGMLSDLRPRWSHVVGVGRRAEDLASVHEIVDETLVAAAWLHDVGYGAQLRRTGQHSIDGADFLRREGCPPEVVRLVAHHTGAAYEAEERGLNDELAKTEEPDPTRLDLLTMIDLSVGPDGTSLVDVDRIADILARYSEEDPVYRAVTRSQAALLASSARAKRLLRLTDNWPLAAC